MSQSRSRSRTTKKRSTTPEVAFGLLVRERRLELGMTQADLEADDVLDRSYISRIESGQRQVCLRGILHLAKKLGWTPAELMSRLAERLSRA